MDKVVINTDFIKLDQMLKYAECVDSGGMAKNVIADGLVMVNGQVELRRGRKLRNGDIVELGGQKYVISKED